MLPTLSDYCCQMERNLSQQDWQSLIVELQAAETGSLLFRKLLKQVLWDYDIQFVQDHTTAYKLS